MYVALYYRPMTLFCVFRVSLSLNFFIFNTISVCFGFSLNNSFFLLSIFDGIELQNLKNSLIYSHLYEENNSPKQKQKKNGKINSFFIVLFLKIFSLSHIELKCYKQIQCRKTEMMHFRIFFAFYLSKQSIIKKKLFLQLLLFHICIYYIVSI